MRELLVTADGGKTFKLKIPDNAKVTFGPWAPPGKRGFEDRDGARGTLRVYDGGKENIVACYSGVTGFRDTALGYAELVTKQEGASLWRDDEHGYVSSDTVSRKREWVDAKKVLNAPKSNGHARKR